MSLILTPGKVTLSELSQIYWESSSVELNPDFKGVAENAARFAIEGIRPLLRFSGSKKA